jgi:hypothetical protein
LIPIEPEKVLVISIMKQSQPPEIPENPSPEELEDVLKAKVEHFWTVVG